MQAIDIVKAALFTPNNGGRWGLVVNAEGLEGAGKSAMLAGLAGAWGLPLVCLSPSTHGEGAFGVVPVPEGGYLTYPPPLWTKAVEGPAGGIVFVDEMTSCGPALQAPIAGLVHDGRIGDHVLGPKVRRIGACNPPDVAMNGYDLPRPLANRLGWVNWTDPTVEEHIAYMLASASGANPTQGGNALAEESRVLSLWGAAYGRAVGLENAFLRTFGGAYKNRRPQPGEPARAYPTDRSWENATRARASADVHGLSKAARSAFVASYIGSAMEEQFDAFEEKQDLPDLADVLDGKVTFHHEIARMDRSFAICNGCVAMLSEGGSAKAPPARVLGLWKLLDAADGKLPADVTAPTVIEAIRSKLVPSGSDVFKRVAARHNATIKVETSST